MDVAAALKNVTRLLPPQLSRRAQTGPIGIDFGTERVNIVQVTRGDDGCVVRAATSLAYDAGRDELLRSTGEVRRLLRRALGERPFRGRKVVASVPAVDGRNAGHQLPLRKQCRRSRRDRSRH